MGDEPRALRIPITPKPEFREALRRYVISRLEEAGVDSETARRVARSDILKIRKVRPKSSIGGGVREVLGRLAYLADDDCLRRDLRHIHEELRREDPRSFGDAVLWTLGVRRVVAEAARDLLLERPDFAKAVDLWLAGEMLKRDELEAAVKLLERAGYEVPEPPARISPPETAEIVRELGAAMIEATFAAHALSNRMVGSSALAEVIEGSWYVRQLSEKGRSGLLEDLLNGLRDQLEDLAGETLVHEVSEGELRGLRGTESSAFEPLGIDDLRSFSRRARDELERSVDLIVEVVESARSPIWMAKVLLRASPEIKLGDRTLGPDVYDPRWGIWEHAHELLERDLGELDRVMEGMLERAVEEIGARILEGIAGRLLGSGNEDLARRAAELAAEIAKRAISSERGTSYGGSSLDSLSELVGSVVRDVLGGRRRSS